MVLVVMNEVPEECSFREFSTTYTGTENSVAIRTLHKKPEKTFVQVILKEISMVFEKNCHGKSHVTFFNIQTYTYFVSCWHEIQTYFFTICSK